MTSQITQCLEKTHSLSGYELGLNLFHKDLDFEDSDIYASVDQIERRPGSHSTSLYSSP